MYRHKCTILREHKVPVENQLPMNSYCIKVSSVCSSTVVDVYYVKKLQLMLY